MQVFLNREDIFLSKDIISSVLGIEIEQAIELKLVASTASGYINKFVGWWSAGGRICLSLPKVFPMEPTTAQLRVFAMALRRYCSNGIAFFQDGSSPLRGAEDLPFLFDRLAEHTYQFGWHSIDSWETSDSFDYADWARTTIENIAVGPPECMFFVESSGARPSLSQGRLISVQARALIDLWDGLSGILLTHEARHLQLVDDARAIFGAADPDSSPEEIVRDHLDTNRDHDRILAKMLGEWLGIHSESNARKSYNGTTSFEHVWEEMIRSSLAGTSGYRYVYHSDVASQPCYRTATGKLLHSPGKQRPDAILKTNKGFVIIDAKWYAPNTFPGTNDVMKQIAYAETCHSTVAANVFAVPTLSEKLEIIGFCHLEKAGTADGRFLPILILGVPILQLMDCYSSNREFIVGKKIIDLICSVNFNSPNL
jgi:hypothetical protein